jgi:methyl-accepting chemotaxis protein
MSPILTVFLVICSLAVIAVTVMLVRMANQLVRSGAELERLARSLNEGLLPRVERVLDQTQAELVELRTATEAARKVALTAGRAAEAVRDITTATRDAVSPVLRAVEEIGSGARQVTAMVVGFKTALSVLHRPHD